MALDLVCIGDCTTDMYFEVEASNVSTQNEQVCFIHGAKIPAKDAKINSGGNAFNVAVGVTKLGLSTGIYTELSTDLYGKNIFTNLTDEHVETSLVKQDEHTKDNVSVILSCNHERTIFSYHGHKTYNLPDFDAPKVLFYTSLGSDYQEIQQQVVEFISKNHTTLLVVNPGSAQIKLGLDTLTNVLAVTDILFVNKDEAQSLVGKAELLTLHKKLHALGPKLTVITDNINGSSAYDGKELLETGIEQTDLVVDKTGAGDAYTSGFIAAILQNKPLKTAMAWGTKNSASVISRVGSTHGLLSKADLL